MINDILKENYVRINETKKTSMLLVFIRSGIFLLIIFLFSLDKNIVVYSGLIILGLSFAFFVKKHSKVHKSLSFFKEKDSVLKNEIDRRGNNLDKFHNGSLYGDYGHLYSTDLNIFGKNSLFHHINRSGSTSGRNQLAQILCENQLSELIINERQSLVQELENRIEEIIEINTLSHQTDEFNHAKLKETSIRVVKTPKWLFPFQLSVVISATVLLFFNWIYAIPILGICAIVNRGFNVKSKKELKNHSKELKSAILQCKEYLALGEYLIQLDLQSNIYTRIRESLVKCDGFIEESKKLNKWIDRLLYSKVDFFGSSSNAFYAFPNQLFALDHFLISKVLFWTKRNQQNITKWIAEIGIMEAYCSIGMYSQFKSKDWIFPTLMNNSGVVGEKVGHPLLPSDVVLNDVVINEGASLKLITGSNMSGKSTYLRTIGVNMVLAKLGSRVYAETFKFYPHVLFTSFSIKDDLSEGVSSFMAEVLRLKMLMQIIEESQNPFFFIDEVLKGTNSTDRVRSTLELIGSLTGLNCLGYITTHDLKIPESLNGEADVYNFSCDIVDNRISYSYEIQKGICHDSNGYFLMKREGVI